MGWLMPLWTLAEELEALAPAAVSELPGILMVVQCWALLPIITVIPGNA